MFSLRPYQVEAKQAVLNEWDKGQRKTLLVLPTGCGKTVVFSSITEHQVNNGHRVLIMAHRGELLTQAADKLKAATGLDSVLEKAESSSLGSIFPVTVGSVQSLAQEKRLARFPNDYFQDIIVDEAHHCLSGTYQRVLEHFPQSNILGVTATPDRGDMKNLGEFFDSKAYEYSMIQAIRDGYLCPIKAQMIPLELDIKNVGISNGDYSAGDIGHALEPYLHQIAAEMKKCCQGRKTVVFLPLIAISQKFCKILNEIGFKAAEVNGGSDDRAEVLSDFENGKYDVLCNSMLLTEGWDCPSVDCIVVLRPTKNRSLYCLDESTEVLTKDGWKKDVNVGELVAAFNPSTSEITYVPALAKVRRPLFEDEYFCSAKGPSTDVRVTNHHRMIYDHKARHGWKIKEAEQIASFKSGCYLPVAGYGAFKGVPLTDAELRFIGWVMTDGHINKRNNAIIISQSSHHKEYCAEIEKCIIDCGFKFSRYIVPRRKVKWKQNGDNVVWTISKGKPRGRDKHLTGWGRLEKWISKDLSPELFEMTEEQFAVMLETIHHADGHKNPYVSYHITKGNKTFIERLQIMGIQRGYRASVVELPENAVRKHSVWTLHIKKQDYITVGDTAGDHTRWVKETHTDEMCWCVQNELGTLVTRRNGKVTIAGNCQIVGRGLRLHPGKEHLLLLDFLWMTTRHDLCKPSSLISKNEEIAEKIDKQIEDTGEVDLIEAEEQAERDVLAEREEALAEELRKLRTRKKQFVDPLQYALSIAAEDLATYTPTFDWEMKPPTQAQLSIISSRGVDTDCVTCAGYASMLIDKLIRRQEAGLSTPKQIRLLEKYGFREVGTWEFSQASNMISMLASHNWRLPNGLIPKAYKPNYSNSTN